MVVFTCNHCGESLQKPRVEKHYQFSCRNVKSLTCVDCFKDFRAEEYAVHTKCITEEERYSAKGSIPNGLLKKGEAKQENWVDMIKSILDTETNMQPSYKKMFVAISNYNNVPRKKPKFINFIKSSLGARTNMTDVEGVWNIIEKYKTSQNAVKNETVVKEEKDELNEMKQKRKMKDEPVEIRDIKKVKYEEDVDENKQSNGCKADECFSFQQKIYELMQKKHTMSLQKLEKKVLNAYIKFMGEIDDKERVLKKIHKKLKKVDGIVLNGDVVSLKDK